MPIDFSDLISSGKPSGNTAVAERPLSTGKGSIDFSDIPMVENRTPIDFSDIPKTVTNSLDNDPIKQSNAVMEKTDIERLSQEAKNNFSFAAKTLEPAIREEVLAGFEKPKNRYNPRTGIWESALPFELLPQIKSPGQIRTKAFQAEEEYQNTLSKIVEDGLTGKEYDSAVKKARISYLTGKRDRAIEPVQQLAEQKRMEAAQKGREKDYANEWVRAWDRGSANVSSAVLQSVGDISGSDDIKNYAAAYYKAISSPELSPRDKGDWVEVGINTVGETMPYMTATAAAHFVAGPVGSFSVGALVEGNSAYQTAKANNVPEGQARLIGFAVGVANGVIENIGGGGGKYLKGAVSRKLGQKIASQGGTITKRALKNAIIEALEEGSQEIITISGERIYRNVNWEEETDRVGKSMAAGGLLGFGFSLSGEVQNIGQKQEDRVSTGTVRQQEQTPAVVEKPQPIITSINQDSSEQVKTEIPEIQPIKPGMPIPSETLRAVQGLGADVTARATKPISEQGQQIVDNLSRIQAAKPSKYADQNAYDAAVARIAAKETGRTEDTTKKTANAERSSTVQPQPGAGTPAPVLYKGDAYRVETGSESHPEAKTAADVIRFEQDELGNTDLNVSPEKMAELEKRPATDIVWVVRTKESAARYAQQNLGDEIKLEDLESVDDYTAVVGGGEIISEIGEDGVLVLKSSPSSPSLKPGTQGGEATPTPVFTPGDIITDGLVNGKVLGEGSIKFGKKGLPAYKIEILSGAEKGKTSLMVKADAKAVQSPEQAKAEALAAIREQASKPVSEQVPDSKLRVVNTTPSDKPIDPKKFYAYQAIDPDNNVNGFVETKGTKVLLPGFENIDAFSNKGKDGTWCITEGRTGLAFGKGKTKKAAFEEALASLKAVESGTGTKGGKKFSIEGVIAEKIKKQGISPRYGGKVVVQAETKAEEKPVPVEEPTQEEQVLPERTPAETLQRAKEDAAGQSQVDFVNKVEVDKNKVMWGDEVLHEYREGYYPTTKDLEILHDVLKQRIKADAAAKGDRRGELFGQKPGKDIQPGDTVSFTPTSQRAIKEKLNSVEGIVQDTIKSSTGKIGYNVQTPDGVIRIWAEDYTPDSIQKAEPIVPIKAAKTAGKPEPVREKPIIGDKTWQEVQDMQQGKYVSKKVDLSKPAQKQNPLTPIADEMLAVIEQAKTDYKGGMSYSNVRRKYEKQIRYLSQRASEIDRSFEGQIERLVDNFDSFLSEKPSGSVDDSLAVIKRNASEKPGVSKNTIITDEAKNAALARQEARAAEQRRPGKKGGFITVFTLDDIKDATQIMGWHVEKGIRTAVDFTKKAVELFGENIRPHLKSIWETLKADGLVTGDYTDETTPTPPVRPIAKPPITPPTIEVAAAPAGEQVVHGVAQNAETAAIEKGIIAGKGGLGVLPTHDVKNMEATQNAVGEVFKADPARVMRIAMGEEAAPPGIVSAIDYFTFVRNDAEARADGGLIRQLINSPVAKEMALEAGRAVKSYDTGDRSGISATDAIKDVDATVKGADLRRQGRKTDADYLGELAAKEKAIKELEVENLIQKELLAQKAAKAPRTPAVKMEYGRSNKIISQERHIQNRAKLRSLLDGSQLRSGLDPRILEIGIEEGLYHAEALGRRGASMFAELSAKLKEDFGDKITPYLKHIYDGVTEKQRSNILDKIKESILPEGINKKFFRDAVAELTKQHINEGIHGREKLIDAVHADIKELLPGFTREQTYDAVSRYGEFSAPSKDEVEVEYRRVRGESLQLSKLQDMAKGNAPAATGQGRQAPSDEQRRLTKLVNEAKKKGGFVVVDPARQLKSALATKETRLTNRIADVRAEIASGQRLIKDKTVSPDNARTIELQKELDGLLAEHKAIFGDRKLTDEQKLQIAEKATQRSIDELDRRIKEGDLMSDTKAAGPTSTKLTTLKARQETLRSELKALREADPVYVAEMNRRSDAAYEKSLVKKLADLEAIRAKGEFRTDTPTRRVRKLTAEAQTIKSVIASRKSLNKEEVGITAEQADRIAVLAKDAVDAKVAMEAAPRRKGNGPDTPEEVAYGNAAVAYQDYVDKLKHDANKKTWADFRQTPIRSTLKAVLNTANISKALKGAWDDSFILRQGVRTIYTSDIPDLITALPRYLTGKGDNRPRFIASHTFVKSLDVILGTFGGEDVVNAMKAHQISDPMYDIIKKTKTDIASIEEAHPADMKWIDRIPGVGKIYRASEHAYTLSSYYMRFELAKLHIQIAQASGVDFKGEEGTRQLEAIGKMINSLTARGKIGKQNNAPGWVNAVIWSPKMLKGSIDVLTGHAFDSSMDGTYAKQAAGRNLLKVIAVQALILAIAKAIDPDSVEIDPRSSDFGKIRVGDTRFDISGGMDSLIVLAMRLSLALAEPWTDVPAFKSSASGETHFLTKGDYREQGALSVVWDFLTNKTSPFAGVIVNHLRGEDRQGNKPTVLGDLRDLFAPMPATTAQELLSNPNSANVFVAMILDELGSSTNTYPDSAYSKVKKFIEDSSQSLYKKSAADLTPQEYSTIVDSPGYKAIEIEYKQTRRQGPARFQQSAEVYEAGKKLYDGLPDDTRKSLWDRGITTIGIDNKVNGQPLSDKRFQEYADTVAVILQSHAKDIISQTDKDLPEYISYLKEVARMDDRELSIALYKKVKGGVKPDQAAHLRILTEERDRRSKLKK